MNESVGLRLLRLIISNKGFLRVGVVTDGFVDINNVVYASIMLALVDTLRFSELGTNPVVLKRDYPIPME